MIDSGGHSIDGYFITSNPMKRFLDKSFQAQILTQYNRYSGSMGTIDNFVELESLMKVYDEKVELDEIFKYYINKYKGPKIKKNIILKYLSNQKYNIGELKYIVDYSTPCGYEIITYTGYKEIPLTLLEVNYLKYLDHSKKRGYVVFKLTHRKSNVVGLEVSSHCDSLKEIEKNLKPDIIKNMNVYFAIKNDGTKAYMFSYRSRIIKELTQNQIKKANIKKAYPVYYYAMTRC